jgi:hypothetical protein
METLTNNKMETLTKEQQEALFSRHPVKGLHTGLDHFHVNFGAEIYPGESWLIAGVVGSGKTRLACQIAGEMASRSRNVLMLLSEGKAVEVLKRCFCAAKRKNIRLLNSVLEAGDREDPLGQQFERWVKKTSPNLQLVEAGIFSTSFKDKMEDLLEAYKESRGVFPDLLIIDGLPYDVTGLETLKAREQLRQLSISLQCITLGTCQMGKEGHGKKNLVREDCVGGSGSETGIIGITSLWSETPPEGAGDVVPRKARRQHLVVLKNDARPFYSTVEVAEGGAYLQGPVKKPEKPKATAPHKTARNKRAREKKKLKRAEQRKTGSV